MKPAGQATLDLTNALKSCNFAQAKQITEANSNTSLISDVLPTGVTPLQYGALLGKPAFTELLLKLGAVVDSQSMQFAAKNHNAKTLQVLVAYAEESLLSNASAAVYEAAFANSLECMKILLEAGAGVSFRGWDGATALHCAAASGNAEMVEALLAAGARASAHCRIGCTPAHWARRIRHDGVCDRLAEVSRMEQERYLNFGTSDAKETNGKDTVRMPKLIPFRSWRAGQHELLAHMANCSLGDSLEIGNDHPSQNSAMHECSTNCVSDLEEQIEKELDKRSFVPDRISKPAGMLHLGNEQHSCEAPNWPSSDKNVAMISSMANKEKTDTESVLGMVNTEVIACVASRDSGRTGNGSRGAATDSPIDLSISTSLLAKNDSD